MSEEKKAFEAKSPILIDGSFDHSDAGFSSGHEVIDMIPIMEEEKSVPVRPMHPRPALPGRVGIVGNYLPRRCGIATFTTDLCDALHAEYGTAELLALPVNDTEEGKARSSNRNSESGNRLTNCAGTVDRPAE